MKFRKKPVVIDAIQYNGNNAFDIAEWAVGLNGSKPITLDFAQENEIVIRTLEGNMTASANDWIIRGVEGEFYPCKPNIFEKTYEAI